MNTQNASERAKARARKAKGTAGAGQFAVETRSEVAVDLPSGPPVLDPVDHLQARRALEAAAEAYEDRLEAHDDYDEDEQAQIIERAARWRNGPDGLSRDELIEAIGEAVDDAEDKIGRDRWDDYSDEDREEIADLADQWRQLRQRISPGG